MNRPPIRRASKGPSAFLIVVALLAIVAALVALAGFLGRYWWFADIAANFRPQLGVVLVLAAIILFLGRWGKMGLVLLIVAAIDLYPVVTLYRSAPTTPASEAEVARVVSFNLLAANTHYDEVIDFLRSAEADLVFLHEASQPWEETIEEAGLGYELTPTRGNEIFGTLVLSSGDLTVNPYSFAFDGERAVEVKLPIGGQTVAVLGIHPLSPSTSIRAGYRDRQLAFAATWASQQEGPTVVVGDFNASTWSHTFKAFQAAGLIDSQAGFGIQPSFPARSNFALRIPIDHLLYSEELAVVDRRLGPALGSDHFPLVVDLSTAA